MGLDMQTARRIGAAAITLGCLAGLGLALQPKAPSSDPIVTETRDVSLRGAVTADAVATLNQAPIAKRQSNPTPSEIAVAPEQPRAVAVPILTAPAADQHRAQHGLASASGTNTPASQAAQSASTRAPAPPHWGGQQIAPSAKPSPPLAQMAQETAQASSQVARAQKQVPPQPVTPLASRSSQSATPPFDQRQQVAKRTMPISGDKQAPLPKPALPTPAAPTLQSASTPAQVAASSDETVVVKARRAIVASRTPIDAIGKGNSVTIRLPRRTGR